MKQVIFASILLGILIIILAAGKSQNQKSEKQKKENKMIQENNLETATFGEGCFWCSEAIFERVEGVKSVTSGYAGGTVANPSYKQVCAGTTGHAESIQLTFDPKVVSYDELLEIFWKTHDPTTLNRQGADVGTQYRSVIFYHNEEQKKKAESYKEELTKAGIWSDPIVTQIVPFTNFYPAEDYHQEYYANNPNQQYCSLVITPKVEKFEKIFKKKLKKEYKEEM